MNKTKNIHLFPFCVLIKYLNDQLNWLYASFFYIHFKTYHSIDIYKNIKNSNSFKLKNHSFNKYELLSCCRDLWSH